MIGKNVKVIEIRDRMTFIPAMAVKLDPQNEEERYLLSRAGYGMRMPEQRKYVQLSRINAGKGEATCDPYDWRDRTLAVAHQHLIEHWDEVAHGAVVDVEFILGESAAAKKSESKEVEDGFFQPTEA